MKTNKKNVIVLVLPFLFNFYECVNFQLRSSNASEIIIFAQLKKLVIANGLSK